MTKRLLERDYLAIPDAKWPTRLTLPSVEHVSGCRKVVIYDDISIYEVAVRQPEGRVIRVDDSLALA